MLIISLLVVQGILELERNAIEQCRYKHPIRNVIHID